MSEEDVKKIYGVIGGICRSPGQKRDKTLIEMSSHDTKPCCKTGYNVRIPRSLHSDNTLEGGLVEGRFRPTDAWAWGRSPSHSPPGGRRYMSRSLRWFLLGKIPQESVYIVRRAKEQAWGQEQTSQGLAGPADDRCRGILPNYEMEYIYYIIMTPNMTLRGLDKSDTWVRLQYVL